MKELLLMLLYVCLMCKHAKISYHIHFRIKQYVSAMLTACSAAKKNIKTISDHITLMWFGAFAIYSTAKKLKQQVTLDAKLSQSAAEENT